MAAGPERQKKAMTSIVNPDQGRILNQVLDNLKEEDRKRKVLAIVNRIIHPDTTNLGEILTIEIVTVLEGLMPPVTATTQIIVLDRARMLDRCLVLMKEQIMDISIRATKEVMENLEMIRDPQSRETEPGIGDKDHLTMGMVDQAVIIRIMDAIEMMVVITVDEVVMDDEVIVVEQRGEIRLTITEVRLVEEKTDEEVGAAHRLIVMVTSLIILEAKEKAKGNLREYRID